ncbi:hypothetical protein [Streptomyces sp. NPDC057052]|uniref:hypothetical protein n=1 Tax=Streptomyces sp. NPDC057052 TaxID=3346010 RepID=UPI00363CD8C3
MTALRPERDRDRTLAAELLLKAAIDAERAGARSVAPAELVLRPFPVYLVDGAALAVAPSRASLWRVSCTVSRRFIGRSTGAG